MVHGKMNEKIPPIKKQKLSKKPQEKEDKININLQMGSKNWNDWKFYIYWNKFEWLHPRSCIERKNNCVF